MKKGINFNIQINFTNRFLYTFVAFIFILIIGVAVYALTPGVAPNPGHLFDEFAPPTGCGTNQVLQWDGTNWVCTDLSSGGSSPWSVSGSTVSYSGDVKWGSSGGTLSGDQGASIELRGTGVPFIDFTNDASTDFDMRLILQGNDVLEILGGNLNVAGNIVASGTISGGTVIGNVRERVDRSFPSTCPSGNTFTIDARTYANHEDIHWNEVLGSDGVWRQSSVCIRHEFAPDPSGGE